jgi:hypothetical protein
MAVTYTTGANVAETQAGTEVSTSPEGLVTLTLIKKGKPSAIQTWADTFPSGTACLEAGFGALVSVATPRIVRDGAFWTAYGVFQGTPAGEGTSEEDLDINHTTENRSVPLPIGADGSDVNVTLLAPTVTASYVALSKPASFRFEGLVTEDPVIVGKYRVPPAPLTEADYTVLLESKWLERRKKGSIWHITEQHANIIERGTGD